MWLNIREILPSAERRGVSFRELLKSYGISCGRKLGQECAKP
jgi:hypothetical protein